jgi:beta-lactamase regulating signal transducer with metallopeptidase domain
MNANTLLATIAILLALGFWLLGQLKFLVPYHHILFHQYGALLLLWLAVLFINVFAALYAIQRKFFLKDTGRKLTHVDNQALAGSFSLPGPAETEEED